LCFFFFNLQKAPSDPPDFQSSIVIYEFVQTYEKLFGHDGFCIFIFRV
jgi:hypothetical protein